jgi:hypothetical protein
MKSLTVVIFMYFLGGILGFLLGVDYEKHIQRSEIVRPYDCCGGDKTERSVPELQRGNIERELALHNEVSGRTTF